MDHELVPRHCDWLLNSSYDHFGLRQGKNVTVTMEFKVPKRHILRPTWSNGFCSGRSKRDAWVGKKPKGHVPKKHSDDTFFMKLFRRREDEDKERQINGQT